MKIVLLLCYFIIAYYCIDKTYYNKKIHIVSNYKIFIIKKSLYAFIFGWFFILLAIISAINENK